MRSARERLGLSLQAAGELADISPGYIFKLEAGYVGSPSPRVLHRLAGVLNVGYWELMGLAGYVVPEGPLNEPPPPPPAETGARSRRSLQETQAGRGGDPLERIATTLEGIRAELRELNRRQDALKPPAPE